MSVNTTRYNRSPKRNARTRICIVSEKKPLERFRSHRSLIIMLITTLVCVCVCLCVMAAALFGVSFVTVTWTGVAEMYHEISFGATGVRMRACVRILSIVCLFRFFNPRHERYVYIIMLLNVHTHAHTRV